MRKATLSLALMAALSGGCAAAAEENGNRSRTDFPPAASGGACVSYQKRFASGAMMGCPVKPGPGVLCALGLPFATWRCVDGQWIPVPR